MTLILTLALIHLMGPTELKQPKTPAGEVSDRYHDVTVADPYRHLEQMNDPKTREWVLGQDAYARRYLSAWPDRAKINASLTKIGQVTRFIQPSREGGRLFYVESTPGVGRGAVWMQADDEAARVALPVEAHGKDRELQAFFPSPDGKLLAYITAPQGGRWGRVQLRDLETGRDRGEVVTGYHTGLSSLTWSRDGKGFFYNRYQEPAAGMDQTTNPVQLGLFFHRLGQGQDQDPRVFHLAQMQDWYLSHAQSMDGRYTVIVGRNGERREVYAAVGADGFEFKRLFQQNDAVTFLGSVGERLFFQTNHQAPRGRVVAVSAGQAESRQTIVPEGEHTLIGAAMEDDIIVTTYRRDAMPALSAWRSDGTFAFPIQLPKIAATYVFPGQPGDHQMMLTMSNLTDPGSVWRLDTKTGKIQPVLRAKTQHDPDAFITSRVFYQSMDGTRVPMFLVKHRDQPKDGKNPLFMYGYGAGNWPAFPWYQSHLVAWLEMGGVYAMPCIRGGGEYGEIWHQAGIRRNKQNAIDDFIAAAEWLIQNGHTTAQRLVCNGGSASGPLVGAALVQRPELFGGALIEWPALDMVRFDQYPGGRFWVWGNGSPGDPDDFKSLISWSPYHNLKRGTCYPPTLLVLGENDESTIPAHGYKFQAALQEAMGCENPVLTRMIWNGGHYQYGVTDEASHQTQLDILCFLGMVTAEKRPVARER